MTLRAMLFLLVFASGAVQAKDVFVPLRPDTPPLAAFVAWHQAVVNNDFAAYSRLSYSVPGFTPKMAKDTFVRLHKVVPKVLKITAPKTIPNTRNLEFYAIGCTNNTRQIASIYAVPVKGTWQIHGITWGPPWTKDAHVCPV